MFFSLFVDVFLITHFPPFALLGERQRYYLDIIIYMRIVRKEGEREGGGGGESLVLIRTTSN